MLLAATVVQAQITIGGSVYGGGNAGDTGGSTKVTVCAGNLHAVFAGARMANVGGSAFVHIDGEHASNYILADYVYGGNDISGTIGTSDNVPTELTEVIRDEMTDEQKSGKNAINNTWNAFVRISTKTETVGGKEEEADDAQKIYIGQLFGGGNGYYKYETKTTGTGTIVKDALSNDEIVSSSTTLSEPELGKTYLEILGGSIVYAYGGGNNATVTDTTVICLDNPSKVVNSIRDTRITTENSGELLTDKRFELMRINTGFSYPSSDAFQIGRLFGGNNKAEMAIRPIWRLKRGKVRNLYSGGNEGAMTSKTGIHLVLNSADMKVDNVYGGCRMADVNPAKNTIVEETIEGTYFPAGYAARVLVTAGDINNVYGGNDVTGNVYGGNAVGIHSSIKGDVYGGGNGSYPYTDKVEYKNDDIYKDIYYEPGSNSLEALKKFRPNAESVSIRVVGTDKDHPTIIGGAIYCGGNSATLHNDDPTKDAAAELKIGSYVIADKVFLGNNGANMVTTNEEEKNAAGEVTRKEGMLRTIKTVNSNDLTNPDKFEAYMDAVAMDIKPRVVFDDVGAYEPYSTKFGSFYCGGNVGSMKIDGAMEVSFNDKVIIYNKVVGGSNEANVYKTDYNAQYLGGLLGDPDANGNKVILNFGGLKIQPMRWIDPDDKSKGLEWNTVDGTTYNTTTKTYTPMPPVVPTEESATGEQSTDDDLKRRFQGGNIYGGCYNNGHVNGNVVINLNASLVDRKGENAIFDEIEEEEGEAKLYGKDNYKILKRNTGVILDEQGMDVLGRALNVFGGGYGGDSEIWGSTTINLNAGYTFQIFGGGEQGAIGNAVSHEPNTIHDLTYEYDEKYSTYINVRGNYPGTFRGDNDEGSDDVKDHEDMAEAEFIYGGSFEGPIAGSTHINLGNGRIFNSFAGSCNADILGHTETYIGRQVKPTFADKMPANVNNDNAYINGFPWIRDHVYGGNDLGGEIKNLDATSFKNRVSTDILDKLHGYSQTSTTSDVLQAAAYTEYIQGRVDDIFGGCYGDYDYTNSHYNDYTYSDGKNKDGFTKPRLDNAFINFKPNTTARNSVNRIFGAGQGHEKGLGVDSMQNRSYILIDIPQTQTAYQDMAVFGAGRNCGMGMRDDSITVSNGLDKYSAIIDLFRGNIKNVYGGSYNEGFTRRTVVNVPSTSTIKVQNLFGGAYGSNPLYPCDVYESHVNYHSANAIVAKNIYGGNNNADRTLYGQVNIYAPVYNGATDPKTGTRYMASVFGAGYGENTWSQYTEVNLEDGAQVYEVYGGGHNGKVMNRASLLQWQQNDPTLDLSMPGYVECGLEHKTLVHTTSLGSKYNTNVHIKEGATVWNYAYGGGQGDSIKVKQGILGSGDVYGTTYIDLLGGTVKKDLYAAGTSGGVRDSLNVGTAGFNITEGTETVHVNGFTASSTAYIEGGEARNVYGGGWRGSVGYHNGKIDASYTGDRPGETHVIIGKLDGTSFIDGIPAIERNAYAGGEGGPIYGTANITLNNGYIGYTYNSSGNNDAETVIDERYEEKIIDETWKDADGNFIPNNNLETSGNIFGGGYIDNSSVDITNVNVKGGYVRNSVFGGGEIAAIGRGDVYGENDTNPLRTLKGIYKAGKTHVYMYGGWVKRNVFGGGKGIDNLGRTGSLYTNGYVFGQTDVNIYGGEIGTDAGVAQGYGNVFGGGDIGYVYSAIERDGTLVLGKKSGDRYDGGDEGYYYESVNDSYLTDTNGEKYHTEDCHVLVEPRCRVKTAVTINGHDYKVGDYVLTSDLNTLKDKTTDAAKWGCLDSNENSSGIIIHNAVFAGGNVSSGNDQVYANATTVFGNATASIHDIYNRDLITIGTGNNGGLYGDGNLTFVDGYRGLNITNYGTDYYHISEDITIEQYKALTEREAAYYERKFKCKVECTDNEGTTYKVGSTIAEDELLVLFAGQTAIIAEDGTISSTYWEENGVVSRYAGRLMNTIQRADFCGVWGSRMVMKGAQDRVPEIVDYTNYTINRVREVSLNAKTSTAGDTDEKNAKHGNYFGIYSIVNYLGSLTSDVDFNTAKRTTDNNDATTYKTVANGKDYGEATYRDWKLEHTSDRTRNNGNSHNKVALASGVYLELTSEEYEGRGDGLNDKKWGLITGVIELDLINVQTGVGGGFVYAKNEHGVRGSSGKTRVTLTELNQGAVSNKSFTYTTDDATKTEWQSSGNFVHSTQTIIDDCYDVSGRYKGTDVVPAHYWYIKGQVYVYDQYVSAYTGAPNAYSETVNIPLTITAASHGTMKLLNVQPNRYAYYSKYNSETSSYTPLTGEQKLVINDVTYSLNDPISYWDWSLLTSAERQLFVEDTYVAIADCKIGDMEYAEGKVLLSNEYAALKEDYDAKIEAGDPTGVTQKKTVDGVVTYEDADFYYLFRSSNNLSHDEGYLLTYNVNNPAVWNKYCTPLTGSSRDGKITIAEYDKLSTNDQNAYFDGTPTYRPTSNGLYGQREYKLSAIIAEEVYDTYQAVKTSHSDAITDPDGQAVFEPAYLVTDYVETNNKEGHEMHLQEGAKLAKSEYTDAQWTALSSSRDEAYVSTKTIQLSKNEIIYAGQLMTKAKRTELMANTDFAADIRTDIGEYVVPAYYCSKPGLYGGDYYETTKNYRALAAWSSMSETDRKNFVFNYDALDLLIDPAYGGTEGKKYQYDGYPVYDDANESKMIYSLEKPVDYTATYNGNDTGTYNGVTLANGQDYDRTDYEKLPNEQHHYAPISGTVTYSVKESFTLGETTYTAGTTISPATYGSLSDADKANIERSFTTYVVIKSFTRGETPYTEGMTVEASTYSGLGDDKNNVIKLDFGEAEIAENGGSSTFYFCRDSYAIGENGSGVAVTSAKTVSYMDSNNETVTISNGSSYAVGKSVPVGVIITEDSYSGLVNKQLNFTIHGIAPVETSTLFVSRNSDIFDLSKEKIITVVYEYNYTENDGSGMHITPVSERHVVNIHIQFKSGIPTVEDITKPGIVLPGTAVTLRTPTVIPGAYEVTGGGWEIYEKESDAESHTNGIEYTMSTDPLYWYQDGYHVAYYALTYLGKTYSNHVPVSVANYHDLKAVMNDKANHLHVDYDRNRLKRDCKIYINDYSSTSPNGLELLKNLYSLSLVDDTKVNTDANGLITTVKGSSPETDSPFKGHALLNNDTEEITLSDGTLTTKGIKGCQNLQFILRTNISHSGTWTPIGDDDNCFEGTLHGDGYTVSGLDHSLFNNLCGSVYNLGVTGNFTSAGVAEKGPGYVESSWIATSNTEAKTAKPIFGNPDMTDTSRPYRIVNCYFQEEDGATNAYNNQDNNYGTPKRMPRQSFYNGAVAYNLNNFYLYKRYSNIKTTSGTPYSYFTYDNGILSAPQTGYYGSNDDLCSAGYVESRYADGDYRYADGGTTSADDRVYTDPTDGKSYFYPIWPDDYLFFGQNLNYGWGDSHQDVPAHISSTNRVFRAPAYFRSGTMDVAHFNAEAVIPAKSKPVTVTDTDLKDAYPGMTAIDFAGHNDNTWALGSVSDGFAVGRPAFYPPLLDDDGLSSINTNGQTPNLLVYAPAESANKKTYDVLNTYYTSEPQYGEHNEESTAYNDGCNYNRVYKADASKVVGHLVQGGLTATNDHLLVDKQEFYCPIAYTFDDDHRMWYQRTPDNYVDRQSGWETISLPFEAEVVTTDKKGELTHFYEGSSKGHEYWLREYNGKDKIEGNVLTAKFESLKKATETNEDDMTKTVNNTFLWDFFYKGLHNQQDDNSDEYQEYYNYQKDERKYPKYPRMKAGTPYLIGFPGETYYEFDLSGNFKALNTSSGKPDTITVSRQTLTFVSNEKVTVAVSDNEQGTAEDGYQFKTNYLRQSLTGSNWALTAKNNDGKSCFDKTPAEATNETPAVTVWPFRPYFTVAPTQAPKYAISRIAISSDSGIGIGDDDSKEKLGESVDIRCGKHKVIVTSNLQRTADVRIFNVSGLCIANFNIEPGQTIEHPIYYDGVYVVHVAGGRYRMKLAVR